MRYINFLFSAPASKDLASSISGLNSYRSHPETTLPQPPPGSPGLWRLVGRITSWGEKPWGIRNLPWESLMGEAWCGRAVKRTLARLVLLQSPLVPRQILWDRRWLNGEVEDGLIKDFLLSLTLVLPLISYPLCQLPLLLYFLIKNNDTIISLYSLACGNWETVQSSHSLSTLLSFCSPSPHPALSASSTPEAPSPFWGRE